MAQDADVDYDDSGVRNLCAINTSQSQMTVLPLQALEVLTGPGLCDGCHLAASVEKGRNLLPVDGDLSSGAAAFQLGVACHPRCLVVNGNGG